MLGNPVKLIANGETNVDFETWHNGLGSVPQTVFDGYADQLSLWHDTSLDLEGMKKVASNGYKKYLTSRPAASAESVRRSKGLRKASVVGLHPLLIRQDDANKDEEERNKFIEEMKKFRPQSVRS